MVYTSLRPSCLPDAGGAYPNGRGNRSPRRKPLRKAFGRVCHNAPSTVLPAGASFRSAIGAALQKTSLRAPRGEVISETPLVVQEVESPAAPPAGNKGRKPPDAGASFVRLGFLTPSSGPSDLGATEVVVRPKSNSIAEGAAGAAAVLLRLGFLPLSSFPRVLVEPVDISASTSAETCDDFCAPSGEAQGVRKRFMTRPKVPILGEEAPAGEDCVCFGVLGDFISLPSPGNCDKN